MSKSDKHFNTLYHGFRIAWPVPQCSPFADSWRNILTSGLGLLTACSIMFLMLTGIWLLITVNNHHWLLILVADIRKSGKSTEQKSASQCRVTVLFVTLWFWGPSFKHTRNCQAKSIFGTGWKQIQVWWNNYLGMAINIQRAILIFLSLLLCEWPWHFMRV
jgi:hypothetical protein